MNQQLYKTVYSLIYPETKQLLESLWKELPLEMYDRPYFKSQDSIHLDFFKAHEFWVRASIDLTSYSYRYPSAGSSEAIREVIAYHKAINPNLVIHCFMGEYEGFEAYATGYKIPVVYHDRANYKKSIAEAQKKGDLFFITNPSSIDGNIWPGFSQFIKFIENKTELKVCLDICYVGSTVNPLKIEGSDRIIHVFFSLSKTFGVYYHRIGGVYSRIELPNLWGNLWFKNIFSLKFGTKLLEEFPMGYFPNKYKNVQLNAVYALESKFDVKIVPSDVLLLATSLEIDKLNILKRHKLARICLTEQMDRFLK